MSSSYLLDTHILLWWLFNDPKLDKTCHNIIKDPRNSIFVSGASAMALAENHSLSTVLTLDRRDFSLYRPQHCNSFTLLP